MADLYTVDESFPQSDARLQNLRRSMRWMQQGLVAHYSPNARRLEGKR
jgi:hypothetical protein